MESQPGGIEIHGSLKQEVLQLQKQLEDQFVARCELESALSYKAISHDPTNVNTITKPVKDIITEIAILELEVRYLEKYLLSMYRKTFNHGSSSLRRTDYSSKHSCHEDHICDSIKECSETRKTKTLVDSSILCSHSSLSQRSFRISPPKGVLVEPVNSYHSLPLSMLEHPECSTSNVLSLGEHLGSGRSHHFPETPNWLSEKMIKTISGIYCELSDPPLVNQGFLSSPTSFYSSMNESSPRGRYDSWSPPCQTSSSFRKWWDNPFNIEGSKDFIGPYSTVVEVTHICRNSRRLKEVEHKLQKFRSLVSRLEEVDPRKMKHEEKLAFWINVHNALVMHALLVYGVHQNNLQRISLILKAAYNIGGHSVNVSMIQSSILGCRLPRPGQWLQSLLFPKTKFKARDARKAYAIKQTEPLLYFALCAGSRSDPAVRVYTPKRVFHELEAAKEDYISTNFKVHKEQKILLPKIVESFGKDLGLCFAGLVELIEHFVLDHPTRTNIQGKLRKRIEWIPHNFTFRYLLSKELIN